MQDFTRWTDDELDGWLLDQAALIGLAFAVQQRPPLGEGAPGVWFAALRDVNADPSLSPHGLAVVGAEALSERWAKNGLGQILDSLTEGELRRLVR